MKKLKALGWVLVGISCVNAYLLVLDWFDLKYYFRDQFFTFSYVRIELAILAASIIGALFVFLLAARKSPGKKQGKREAV